MQGLAVLILSVGVWVLYAAATGIPPLKTLQEIVAKPADSEKIIADARTKATEARAASKVAAGQTPTATIGQAGTGDVATVLTFARAQLGKPYKLGGAGPNVWDCSGLVKVAFSKVGFTLPHNATTQMNYGTPVVSRAKLVPGDLLFPSGQGMALGGHVQIYTGNGNQIEAPRPGVNVVERPMWGFSGDRVVARRLIVSK